LGDLLGHAKNGTAVDPKCVLSHQRFAGKFEKNTFVRSGGHRWQSREDVPTKVYARLASTAQRGATFGNAMSERGGALPSRSRGRRPEAAARAIDHRRSGIAGSGRHFGSEVFGLLLDTLAHDEEAEALNGSALLFQHLLDALLVVFNKGLRQQRDFLQE